MSEKRNAPYIIDVKKGEKKAICACGQSKKLPFCDGSHVSTDKTPVMINCEEDETLYICGCGKSPKFPHCDGTHAKM